MSARLQHSAVFGFDALSPHRLPRILWTVDQFKRVVFGGDSRPITESQRIMRAAFERVHGRAPTDLELLVLMSHAMTESNFGQAAYLTWPPDGPMPVSGKGPYTRGTNNWGAEQLQGQALATGFFWGLDHHEDGTPYRAKYATFATPEDGATSYVERATVSRSRREKVLPILNTNDLRVYAKAQRSTGYFELPEAKAALAYLKAAKVISKATGLPAPLDWTQGGGGVGVGAVLALGAGAALAIALTKKSR
jgi:hypothetical protein